MLAESILPPRTSAPVTPRARPWPRFTAIFTPAVALSVQPLRAALTSLTVAASLRPSCAFCSAWPTPALTALAATLRQLKRSCRPTATLMCWVAMLLTAVRMAASAMALPLKLPPGMLKRGFRKAPLCAR
jgi:hypothetical protein